MYLAYIERGYYSKWWMKYGRDEITMQEISASVRFGLWCLTLHSTIFQLYCGSQFIGGGNRSTPKENH
jgi:hypothetical protein